MDPKRLEVIDRIQIYSRDLAAMTSQPAVAPEEIQEYDESTLRRFGALILAQSPVLTGVPQSLLATAIRACKSKQN